MKTLDTKKIQIREFRKDDSMEIIRLFYEFGHFLKQLDDKALKLLTNPEQYGERFFKMMLRDTKNKDGKIYVLEDNGRLAGFIAGVVLEVGKGENEFDCVPYRMGRVIELFVSRVYRGKGYGTKLIDTIQKYFKEKNCYKVNIEVFGPNNEAYKFYKKLGYTERNIDLAKVL
jgi:GNAT superfamily N-acetyltransferase